MLREEQSAESVLLMIASESMRIDNMEQIKTEALRKTMSFISEKYLHRFESIYEPCLLYIYLFYRGISNQAHVTGNEKLKEE